MPEHKLWWTPKCGADGRGIITEDGSVITWPEPEMTHSDRAETMGLTGDWAEFYIYNDWDNPGTYSLGIYCLTDEQAKKVLAAIPRMKPPAYWKVPA